MRLAELTTLQVGGEADTVLAPQTTAELIETVTDLWASGDDWLLLGGGSNVVVGDDGFAGTVIRVITRGIEQAPGDDGTVRLRVQAGEPWDVVVATAVANGWAGIEALSGIPGSAGAAPIQNIGAYGQEIGSSLIAVEFLDYLTGDLLRIPRGELGLDYRTSTIKQGRSGLVVSLELRLQPGGLSQPVSYAQLASALGVSLGTRVPLETLRTTVLGLRASKGMIWDPADPDSISAGSFFTNPIVSENFARRLPADAPRWATAPEEPDLVVPLGYELATPEPAAPREYSVKLSAAWLIEHSGIGKGFSLPGSRAAVSSKHTLALVNRGGATAEEILELARFIQTRVYSEFGVRLHPEPVTVGASV